MPSPQPVDAKAEARKSTTRCSDPDLDRKGLFTAKSQGTVEGVPEGTKAMQINGELSTLQPVKFLDFYTVCRVGSRADTAPKGAEAHATSGTT